MDIVSNLGAGVTRERSRIVWAYLRSVFTEMSPTGSYEIRDMELESGVSQMAAMHFLLLWDRNKNTWDSNDLQFQRSAFSRRTRGEDTASP